VKILLKIILFPVSLILTIIVAISSFLIEKCAIILNIASGLIFLGALAGLLVYLFGWPFGQPGHPQDLVMVITGAVLSFLLSPFGLPTLAAWIVSKLDLLNELIKSI
jgi:cytochrome c biogenesis protein CcdA